MKVLNAVYMGDSVHFRCVVFRDLIKDWAKSLRFKFALAERLERGIIKIRAVLKRC
jgi:hypothetical protein